MAGKKKRPGRFSIVVDMIVVFAAAWAAVHSLLP